MRRGQGNHFSYVQQLLRDSCCATIDELQQKMKNREDVGKNIALEL